jgi:hypothetical protein
MLSRGDNAYTGLYEAVAARLDADGFDIVHQSRWIGYVADRSLADRRTVRSGILLTIGLGGDQGAPPGTRILDADPAPDFDRRSFELLVRQARSASKVVIGTALRARIDGELRRNLARKGLDEGQRFLYTAAHRHTYDLLAQLHKDPVNVLAQRDMLELLAATPPAEPRLSQRALDRVVRTYPVRQGSALQYTHVTVDLLDRRQLLQYAPPP